MQFIYYTMISDIYKGDREDFCGKRAAIAAALLRLSKKLRLF